jgi:hypothetical protein
MQRFTYSTFYCILKCSAFSPNSALGNAEFENTVTAERTLMYPYSRSTIEKSCTVGGVGVVGVSSVQDTHTHIVLYVHVLFVRTCLSVVAKYDRCTFY